MEIGKSNVNKSIYSLISSSSMKVIHSKGAIQMHQKNNTKMRACFSKFLLLVF